MSATMDLTVEELLETFEDLQEWDERYGYIIELGREVPEMPAEAKNPATKVEGCMSQVWMIAQPAEDGRLNIIADSDSMIVKGLIAILLAIYSGRTPEEILATEPEELFDKLGLREHLSATRRNGLFAMVKRLRGLAVAHAAA